MRAIWNGAVLAQSDDTVVVEGNHYFPPESLVREHFADSRRRTWCPWKGVASYLHVEVAGERNANAAWYYRRPLRRAARIRGRVAFRRDVAVVPD